MNNLPTITKNLLIINVLCFFGAIVAQKYGINLNDYLGLHFFLASDFNPGSCPCLNLEFVINLGCLKYKLTPEEVLTAVTLNAAAAIKLADKVGSVEPGKQGDLVIWDAPDLDYICYRVGSNLVKTVIKKGAVV